MPNLRAVRFLHCVLQNDDEAVAVLLRNCPLLTHLALDDSLLRGSCFTNALVRPACPRTVT
jgi:hypothetical protein